LVSSAAPLLLRISDFPVITSCTSSDKTNYCSSSSTRKFSTGMLSSPGDNNTTICFQEKSDEAKKVKIEKYFDTKKPQFP
jgi:hypothetical protein